MTGTAGSDEYEVVIVGAGAAGLATAAALGDHGVATLLVEARTEPPTLPRATVISTRSMELLRAWGLEEETLAGGVDADVWLWECPTLARAAEGTTHAVGYPTREQAEVVSPCTPGTVPQDWLEAVLRRHVGARPGTRVELGTELVAINTPRGIRATVHGPPRRGRRATYGPATSSAADGAHSRGAPPPRRRAWTSTPARTAACRSSSGAPSGPARSVGYALYFVTTSDRPGLFLPAGRDDRWVYGPSLALRGGETGRPRPEWLATRSTRMRALVDLDPAHRADRGLPSPGQIADRFRLGAGSSSVMPPTASRHARRHRHEHRDPGRRYDLGWKLAWVVPRLGGPHACSTPTRAERRVVAEHNLARSTDPDGSRRPVLDELHVDLGGRVTHAWLPSAGGRRRPSISSVPVGRCLSAPRASVDDVPRPRSFTVHRPPLDPVTARTLGVHGDGALLARPDGVPVGAWSTIAGLTELPGACAHPGTAPALDLAVA